MIKVTIIFSKTVRGDYLTETWSIDNIEQLSVKNDGITLYDADGHFIAFYYAYKVVGVEIENT